jgi:enoyl-CoA hydratase/carnithine racemase
MALGLNRGRAFLLTGNPITAREALNLGLVMEVVPSDQLLPRAWDLASTNARKSKAVLNATRVAFTREIKRRMLDDLGYGLMAEGLAVLDRDAARTGS